MMDHFPKLYSNKLILRKIQGDDVQALVKYANNKKIADRIFNIPFPYGEHDAVFRLRHVAEGYRNKTRFAFVITLKETLEFVGEISLNLAEDRSKAELGYWIGEPFWNKGITSEAVDAILKYGFENLGLMEVYATVHEDNAASNKIMLKHGFINQSMTGNIIQYGLKKEA